MRGCGRRLVVGSLKEFLEEQAEKLRADEHHWVERRDEWIAAVDRLTDQIQGWLTQADPDQKILKIRDCPYDLQEEGLGPYQVRGLSIGLGPWTVLVKPIARYVAGPRSATGHIHISRAYGRVDLTDGMQKYMIFRVEKEPEDRWNIIEQDGFRLQVFNQASFEQALKSLLS